MSKQTLGIDLGMRAAHVELADPLVVTWGATLKSQFAGRHFDVRRDDRNGQGNYQISARRCAHLIVPMGKGDTASPSAAS